jgi:hypothetical protein
VAHQEALNQEKDRGRQRHRRLTRSNKAPLKNFGTLIREQQVERILALDEGHLGLKNRHHRRWCHLQIKDTRSTVTTYQPSQSEFGQRNENVDLLVALASVKASSANGEATFTASKYNRKVIDM